MTAPDIHAEAARMSAGPVFADVGVIALVPERWGGMWLSRHQILTRLSRYFHVVWQNPARPWQQALTPPAVTNPDPTPPPARGFAVYDHEPWLPKFYRPAALARAAERERLAHARRMLEEAGCRRVILYIWQPKFAAALDLVPYDVSCYHIVDEYSFSDVEQPLSPVERRLIERADQVIVHSPALREKKGGLNSNTAYVTNGVDYAAFAAARPEPADLAAVPRPRIGYVGRIKSQMDWATLGEIARARPEWNIVLVGPVGHMGEHETERTQLLARPNVHYLGNKSVRDIPAYIQHMDVCLLCYALTDYTKFIFPLKLHEYLASGRPVVGSDIRSLREFTSVVRIAHSPAEWREAIAAALGPDENTPARVAERRRVAQGYDWNVLTRRIAELLCDRLGGEYASRLAGLPAQGES
ncbi:MAG TPA: glycosyltransferase [Candidatus Krumholzibacteria bacterium]|nr:glycosyltransferase [Candidatus Krumholzibacteria bacterium]